MEFRPDGSVDVMPLRMSSETLVQLESNLVMFFTGYSRDADLILSEQKSKSEGNDRSMIENLHTMKELGNEVRFALETGDVDGFGEIMNRHWIHKKERSTSMSNPLIDRYYDLALAHGAIGGSSSVPEREASSSSTHAVTPSCERRWRIEGLTEVPFGFDFEGSTVLVRD